MVVETTTESTATTSGEPTTPPTTATPSEQDVIEMNVLLSEGKRNYICNQAHLALDCFVELCEKLAHAYGEESEKCTEAYLYYGKTLLDIARLENGVLGHAIHETPVFGPKVVSDGEVETGGGISDDKYEVDESVEREVDDPLKPEDIRSHVERAMREDNLYNISTTTSPDADVATDGDAMETTDGDTTENTEDENAKMETEDDEAKAKNENKEEEDSKNENVGNDDNKEEVTPPATGAVADKSIACDNSDAEEEEEEDEGNSGGEVSNLQLSWEMLELTAVICKRQLSEETTFDDDVKKTIKCTLAEAKHGLAQISVEMERYTDATNDFTECLALYEDVIEEENSRVIAEAHYNIGLALSFDKKYAKAIERFEKAVSILKKRVEDLQSKVKEGEERSPKDEATSNDETREIDEWKKEILELNDLVVLDMMAKIEDARESENLDMNVALAAELKEDSNKENAFDAGFSNEAIALSDVQVRSMKRKNENEASEEVNGKQMKI